MLDILLLFCLFLAFRFHIVLHIFIYTMVSCDVDTGAKGPQEAVATIALLDHGGQHRNGHQGLGRQLKHSSPHPRHTCKDSRRGGRAGRNTASGSPSTQETKNELDQNK
jgi:hypothetical protein